MGCRVEKKHNCSCKGDCLCQNLKRFINQEVTIRTKSEDVITGELQRVTKDCCVQILEQNIVSPFVNDRLIIIRCEDIESFSIEL
jgi:small nuclear ribonucleoprotein (snRNP)-like protein